MAKILGAEDVADGDRRNALRGSRLPATLSDVAKLSPLAAALAYPYLLKVFHSFAAQSEAATGERLIGIGALVAALCVPLYGLYIAVRVGRIVKPTEFELRARRLAFFSITAPPLFVLSGVGLGLIGTPIRDLTAWNICWISAVMYGAVASGRPKDDVSGPKPKLRVFHGATAALLAIFILFHLSNHLIGLVGPDAHSRVMDIGRTVYRSGAVEPLLIGLLLLQILSGGRLAWHWSKADGDFFRTIQIGSGAYVGAFIVTHLNSALISARLVRGIPTNWAWASGAPEGLIFDAWNVRLIPHYAFGVFFLLLHLCSGLRVVLLAHGSEPRVVNRLWTIGAIASVLVASAILAALCGFRI